MMEDEEKRETEEERPEEILTPGETRRLISSALAAGLAVGAVFLGAFLLLMLFIVFVWLR